MLPTFFAQTEAETHVAMADPLVYGAIAFVFFAVIGFVTWSYRDVANRHSDKVSDDAGHGHH